MAHDVLDAAYEAKTVATKEYGREIEELNAMANRLFGQYENKLAFTKPPGQKKAKALLSECGTIKSQLDKVFASVKDAKARFNAKIDSANARVVEQFRGLASYGVASGKGGPGVKYLLEECQDFDKAAGNYERREACYDSIHTILDAITVEAAAEKKGIAADQLAIYETFDKMEEGEAKTNYFQKHKAVIAAVYDLQKLQ